MKNSLFFPVFVLGFMFLLTSCTTAPNHTMNNGVMMSGATHMTTGASTNTHMMNDASTMSGTMHTDNPSKHTMENGQTMSGSVHTDGDTHTMKDGSTMDGMNMDDGTESQ